MANNKTDYKKLVAICVTVIVLILLFAFIYITFNGTGSIPGNNDNDSTGKTVLPGDDGKIYASLHSEDSDTVSVYPEISKEDVTALLTAAKNQQSSYVWYYKSSLFSRDTSSSEYGIFRYSDNTYIVDIFGSDNSLLRTVTDNGTVILVQRYEAGIRDTQKSFSSNNTTIFDEIGVPEIDSFLNSGDIDFSYSLVDSNYGKLLYAQFTSTSGDYVQSQEYYISLDYGIVVRADCFENNSLIYSLETVSLYLLEENS